MQFYFTYIIKNVHSRFKHGLAYVHCCAPNINPDFLILPASVAVGMKNEMAYAWEIHTTFYISNLLIIDKCILYLLPFVYICTLYKPFMYSFLFPIYKDRPLLCYLPSELPDNANHRWIMLSRYSCMYVAFNFLFDFVTYPIKYRVL